MPLSKDQLKEIAIFASLKKLRVDFSDLKETKKGEDGHTPTKKELVEIIEPLIPEPIPGRTPIKGIDYFDGKDGKTPKKGVDYFDGKDADPVKIALEASKIAQDALLSLIPTVTQIEKDLPILGPEIRDSLELLKNDERLDASAIKGLPVYEKDEGTGKTRVIGGLQGLFTYIDGVKQGIVKTLNFKSGAGITLVYSKENGLDTLTFVTTGGGTAVQDIELSSQIDGATRSFTLPAFSQVLQILYSSAPFTFKATDYTAVSPTLTFTCLNADGSDFIPGEGDDNSDPNNKQTLNVLYAPL